MISQNNLERCELCKNPTNKLCFVVCIDEPTTDKSIYLCEDCLALLGAEIATALASQTTE